MSSAEYGIEDLLDRERWVVGGQNFDEDIHFSSFYIRTSAQKYLPKKAKTGYRTIIAIYENFNETYYIPMSECERVARYFLERIKRQPDWMETIIAKIHQRCTELNNVFSNFNIYSDFSELSLDQIKKLYHKHRIAQWKLYEIARIPEALDRGIEMFSNYLKSYLKKRCKTDDLKEINKLFYVLTMPVKPSIFQEEFFEFQEIIEEIKKIENQKHLFQNPDKRFLLKVNPIILKKIEDHRKKWGFLEYHGYISREIPSLKHYVDRINICLDHLSPWKSKDEYKTLIETIKEEQKMIFSRYSIDEKHQKIFKLYGEIGLVKLFRRFSQLKNFFFLDKLISQIALRTGFEEEIIRCLLPEEIESLIDGKLYVNKNIRSRTEFMTYLIDSDYEKIISGIEHKWIKERLNAKVKSQYYKHANELYGTPVSLGYIKGICKVIFRLQDGINKCFRNGEIIISEATDPDLISLIARAGGVVTQQGGVTSHASIICRELGKPALVGVPNLLDNVRDLDEVILDAYSGRLIITRKGPQWLV